MKNITTNGVTIGENSIKEKLRKLNLTSERNEEAWDFFERVLKSPKYCVAPMVDGSELPFRMLCRKYGADMAWSPMIHSKLYMSSKKYREEFTTCLEDRPLAVQIGGNDANMMLSVAKDMQEYCDVIDINFGCPQNIAKKGKYGAYLCDHWDLVFEIVNKLSSELKVPVSCKIRILDSYQKTIQYAKMIESAGCKLLTVHGRTKEQKGVNEGLADWKAIQLVKEAVNIPVIANGNIRCYSDLDDCLKFTNADAVMSAEGLLDNPFLFQSPHSLSPPPSPFNDYNHYFRNREYPSQPPIPSFSQNNAHYQRLLITNHSNNNNDDDDDDAMTDRLKMIFQSFNLTPIIYANEYLNFCKLYTVDLPLIRGHLFRFLKDLLNIFPEMREDLKNTKSVQEIVDVVSLLEYRFLRPSPNDDFSIKPFPKQLKKKQAEINANKAAVNNNNNNVNNSNNDVII